MAKVTRLALATVAEGAIREFDIDHAEHILQIPNSGWQIPKDSDFEYIDGAINRRNKGKGK